MHPMRHLAIAALAVVLLTGCFPIHYTRVPGVVGKVIDSRTQQPVVDASVTLKVSTTLKEGERQISGMTDATGRFSFAAEQWWGIYVVPMDPLGLPGAITAVAHGYQSATRSFHSGTMGPAVTNLGDIPLVPIQ